MKKIKVMSVFGTRPEAIKMAPLVKELAQREGIESLCCVTAQHREMLDSVMQVFGLKADADLDIMTPRQTLSTITCKCLTGMDEVIDRFAPDMILVHGDTSTTFAGALSAFYHKVKIGHVDERIADAPARVDRRVGLERQACDGLRQRGVEIPAGEVIALALRHIGAQDRKSVV